MIPGLSSAIKKGPELRLRTLFATTASIACCGCLHSPPNYPGAGGRNLEPAYYASSSCPDLSGKYEGRGSLVDGDPAARQAQQSLRIDYAFPFRDDLEAGEMQAAEKGRSPQSGSIAWNNRRATVTLAFATGQPVEFTSSMEDKDRFVCTGRNGKIVWGGASGTGRSEFGPNSTDSSAALYLDEHGDVMVEDHMQVHMSMLFGAIPTGTAKHYSIYRFKRISD